jgi:RNA-directed DNA polymerase
MRDEEAEAHASAARPEADGRNLSGAGLGAESRTAAVGLPKPGFPATGLCRWDGKPEALRLMEAVVERNNLFRAYDRVVKNEGAPGVDGLPVSEFKPWLQRHWVRVRQDLLTGVYQPEAVRKVEIDMVRAWRSATNGRGPWWNGGASHMNAAYPKSWFDRMGLVSLLETRQRLTSAS